MIEPATQTAGAAVAAGTAVTLASAPSISAALGVPLDLVVWGAVGGLIALIYSEPKQPPLAGIPLVFHAAGRLFSGAALGAVLPSAILPVIAAHISGLGDGQQSGLRIAAAVLVGVGTALIPDAIAAARRKLGGVQ